MSTNFLGFTALLLLAACGNSPEQRAQANALRMLAHERPPVHPVPTSLRVYDFSKAQVSYFTSDVPTFEDGHLVTYEASEPAASTPSRRAVYVASNDSAFFFLPARNGSAFTRQFGVSLPATPPDSAARQ